MKRLLLLTNLLSGCFAASAQWVLPSWWVPNGSAVIDANNVRGTIYATGSLWRDGYYLPLAPYNPATTGFEAPKTTGTGAIARNTCFMASLWIGGQDSSGQVYTAAETYRGGNPSQFSYWAGPIGDSTQPSRHDSAFNYVWKITRLEIDAHRASYAQSGYQMPPDIASWPGNGLGPGQALRLAPFIDLNGNNRYEPMLGEYPDVPGDQALFFINNDIGVKDPYSPIMSLELHGLAYAFAPRWPNDPLDQAIFFRYRLFNRSGRTYHDVRLGHWADLDIGGFVDDYVGCDRSRQMMFGYNGDSYDADTVQILGNYTFPRYGYGANPPAQGIVLLSDTLSGFVTYKLDYSTVGMPTFSTGFYHYLRGMRLDGNPFLYGGDGVNNPLPPVRPWPFMYDGDPVTGTGWTEASAGRLPGDRLSVMSAGPYTFAPGQQLTFEIAYVFAQGSGTGPTPHLASVAALQQAADEIRRSFPALSTPTERPAPLAQLTLFPNPAQGTATVRFTLPPGTARAALTLHDALGRLVRTLPLAAAEAPAALNLRGVAAGVYTAALTGADGRVLARQRLIVAE